MSELERRVARAIRDAAGGGNVAQAEAALKAHAEYLAEHNMRVITFRRVERQPFVFDAEDLQQDQSHE